jgi:hypothetical protein
VPLSALSILIALNVPKTNLALLTVSIVKGSSRLRNCALDEVERAAAALQSSTGCPDDLVCRTPSEP